MLLLLRLFRSHYFFAPSVSLRPFFVGGLPAEAREPESILAERVEATQFFFSDDTPAPGAMRSPGVFFQMLFQFFLM